MSKVKSIGLIVEDNSDFNCLVTIIKRILKKDNIKFKKVIGNGCGKIKKKALAWSENLHHRGCNVLILIQDLDRNDLKELKNELKMALSTSPISKRLICIPIEELEAWLLSDQNSLKQTFNLKRVPRISGKPETISSPKEKLRDIVYSCSDKNILYITKHNERIAMEISIELMEKKCPSFSELNTFVNELKF
jgi:hypothetical protein